MKKVNVDVLRNKLLFLQCKTFSCIYLSFLEFFLYMGFKPSQMISSHFSNSILLQKYPLFPLKIDKKNKTTPTVVSQRDMKLLCISPIVVSQHATKLLCESIYTFFSKKIPSKGSSQLFHYVNMPHILEITHP